MCEANTNAKSSLLEGILPSPLNSLFWVVTEYYQEQGYVNPNPRQQLEMRRSNLQPWAMYMTEMVQSEWGCVWTPNLGHQVKIWRCRRSHKRESCGTWQPTLIISAPSGVRQEEPETEASLGNKTGSCLRNKQTHTNRKQRNLAKLPWLNLLLRRNHKILKVLLFLLAG